MSELNHVYGYGVLMAMFDNYQRPIMDLRHISRSQFKDQLRAGMSTGRSLLHGGWPL